MKYFALLILVFWGIQLNAQDVGYSIKGKITNQDTGASEGGVTVSLKQNGSVVASTTTSSSGKYSLKTTAPQGAYELVFSKNGMVSKKILINSNNLNVEDLPAGNEIPIPDLDLDMFATRPSADFSFLDSEPVASFAWDSKKMVLDFDRVASEKTRKKINDLLLKAEQNAAANEANYNKAISAADALADQKKYEDAVAKYEEALGYKPKEAYPAERIVALEALIQTQKEAALKDEQANSEYNNLIKAADNLRNSGNLEGAISKYEEALTKKSEQYPKDQIAALKAKIEQQKKEAENEAAYKVAIEKGDMFLKQNSLKAARDKYTEATNLKPSEQYPKDKLKEIEGKLKAQEDQLAKKQKYEEAVAAGDASFTAGDFKGAKAKYEEALTYEAAATYPKERIKLCDDEIAKMDAEKKKEEDIKRLLAEGNTALTAKQLDKAKSSFEGVLALDSENAEAKQKLQTVAELLKAASDEKAKEEQFKKLVADGDAANTAKKYQDAISNYEQAIALKKDPGVETKLKAAQTALAAEQDATAKQKAYEDAIKAGDAAMSSKDYAGAKTKYNEALALKPSEQYPKDKIKEADNQLSLLDKEAKYNGIIADADGLFAGGKLEEAKQKYVEAKALDASKSYPTDQIKKIDSELANNAAAKQKEESYQAALTKADQAFKDGKWQDAIKAYDEALKFATDPSYAQSKKGEAQSKLNDAAAAAKKQADFDKVLGEAKNQIASKSWDAAKEKLTAALAILPENQEAQTLLSTVNSELAKAKSAAEQEAEFAKLKQEGMDLFAAADYVNSRTKFNEALAIKEDQVIRKKLSEIQSMLDSQAKDKEILEKYERLMNEGAGFESQSKWQDAINKYKEASATKPNEQAPKDRIAALEQKLLAAQDQAKIDAEYKEIMKKGDQLMAEKKYLDAIQEFNKALTLKPTEQEPVIKAKEAERLEKEKSNEGDQQYEKILTVAQAKMDEKDFAKAKEYLERAKTIKPDDKRPIEMLAELDRLQKEEAKYQQMLSAAAGLEAAKNYQGAKDKYLEASNLRPAESFPKEKADEMQRKINSLNDSAAKEALYKDYMNQGAAFMNQKSYEQALSAYQNAISTKPGDVPAQDKINEVQQILDDIANADRDAIDRKNKFDAFIKAGDDLFAAADYLSAVKKYEEALKLDPSSKYAKKQIEEAIRLEKEKGNIEAEREYRKIIEAADKNFMQASYDKARDYYNRALSFKANDPYPKQKLKEIDDILNPKTVASVELEDLGDPYEENSITDGQALLRKAEEQRKLMNSVKTKAELDEIALSESEMTNKKTAEHYDNSNQIYLVQQKVTQDAGEAQMDLQANTDLLRKAEASRLKADSENQHFDNSENLMSQDILNTVDREVALKYGEDISVYSENADHMEMFNRAQGARLSAEMNKDKDRNIGTDQELSQVKLKVDQDVRDDIEDRVAIHAEVFDAESKAIQRTTEIQDEKYVRLVDSKGEINRVVNAYETKYVEDSRSVANNEEELKVVRYNKNESDTRMNAQKDIHLKQTDSEIRTVQLKTQEDSEGRDDSRVARVEIIKEGNKQLAEANYGIYNDELEKYVSNKATINQEVNKNNGVNERAEEALDRKIAYVEGVDKKARMGYEEDRLSDEEERQGAQRGIEFAYSTKEASASKESVKLEENTSRLTDMTKTMDAEKAAQNVHAKDKLYDNAGVISKVDNTPKPKVRVANELGQEYPEGVTQESFTRSDQNGLMTTIITRRIVVIEGKADVYVRTQTLNGITYTKNDQPTLEHVWNKETQGPHLERHY